MSLRDRTGAALVDDFFHVQRQVENQVDNQVREKIHNQIIVQVRDKIKSQVDQEQVTNKIWSQVGKKVEKQVWGQTRFQIWNQINNKVLSQVWNQIINQIGNEVQSKIWSQTGNEIIKVGSLIWNQISNVYPYFDCQFWSPIFSYYEFFKNEFNIQYNEEYDILLKCAEYGMVFPLDKLCIVCQPFTEIYRNKNGLHNEHGPALSYNGKFEIYALNGVSMNEKYIKEEVTGDMIFGEKNVDVRRELLRRVGIERAMEGLPHKTLEKKGNYELFSIDLSDEIKNAKYLKMLNPSIGVYHIEGVEPSINTIEEALKWRNQNLFVDADILT